MSKDKIAFTAKQTLLMACMKYGELKRINILQGSVSSGKTWISLVLWGAWIATRPTDYLYMMCAKSLTTLKRNCLFPMQDLYGKKNFSFNMSSKEARLFGRKILLEGANDARSESKIRGLTLGGAYCDELTLFPEEFFKMLLSRLRVEGAKLIGTTNPDTPGHWLKKDYIDNADKLDALVMEFLIDDNTTLPKEYVESLKKEYSGVFYDRFILGKWVNAQGAIYPDAADGKYTVADDPARAYLQYHISIDYGTQNPCSMGLWGLGRDGVWYRFREYYHSGRDTRHQLTDEEYYQQLVKLADGLPVRSVIIDPSAASFITLIRRYGRYMVRQADNAVLDGIRNVAAAMQTGKIRFCKSCTNTHAEFNAYRWDEKSGEDKPIKENDHAMDDIRYFVNTVLGRGSGMVQVGRR